MNNKIALALSALTILLVLAATTGTASATSYVPGVKAGNTATFSVVGNPALPYNRTDITVYGKTGSYVQLTAVNYRPDGSLYSVEAHNWTVDTYGSSSYADAVFFWVVSANLTKGDTVLADPFPTPVVVQSNLTMTAAGVSRFVLYANGSGIFVDPFLMYFDRATGLVVKGNYQTMAGWINVTLVSTNVWSIATTTTPGGLPLTILEIGEAAVIVVLLVVLVFVMRRGKK
jgi:hypothetical protein